MDMMPPNTAWSGGYAASQQAQLFTAGEQPAKVSGKSRRR